MTQTISESHDVVVEDMEQRFVGVRRVHNQESFFVIEVDQPTLKVSRRPVDWS
jgi:hypothetical protein